MSKAHINSDILLANRPVVIDSPSTAYFPFNNTLVSQGYSMYPLVDPVTGYISGASNSIEGVLQKYDHTGLIVPGRYSSGVILDEETTNYISNPTIFSSGWNPYTNGNNGSFITEFGIEGLNIINKQSWCGAYRAVVLPSTGIYTFSVYAKPISRTQTSIGMTLYTSGFGLSDQSISASWDDDKVGKWQRLSMTRNLTAANGTIFLICYGGTNTAGYEITGQYVMPQIEYKGYNTSFVSGTRNETNLTYPRYPIKTVSCWVKSTSNKVIDSIRVPRTILRQVDSIDSYPQWSLYACNTNTSEVIPGTATPVPAGSAVLMIKWKTNGVDVTTYLCTVSDINILDGGWHHITCEFGLGSICRISVDDKYGDTLSIPEINYNFNGQLRVGYDSTSELSGNFLIDELRLDNHTYSRDDIRRRFVSGVEYYNPYSYESTCIT